MITLPPRVIMKKYRQTKTVYAEQWFPPEDPRHIPIEGMVKIPRHVPDQPDGDYHFTWKLEDTWVYWGGVYDCDYHPIYLCINSGWWVVRTLSGHVETVEYFLEQGFELDTEE